MNDLTDLNAMETEIELKDEERQPCEVWTRVMGYHRPVASFNIGKKGEYAERRFFREPGGGIAEGEDRRLRAHGSIRGD